MGGLPAAKLDLYLDQQHPFVKCSHHLVSNHFLDSARLTAQTRVPIRQRSLGFKN